MTRDGLLKCNKCLMPLIFHQCSISWHLNTRRAKYVKETTQAEQLFGLVEGEKTPKIETIMIKVWEIIDLVILSVSYLSIRAVKMTKINTPL